MNSVKTIMHGAISIVNAISTGKGATLGISLKTTITVTKTLGTGISIKPNICNPKLITAIIKKLAPSKILEKNKINVTIDSEIPAGYGLKSSSIISTGIALSCAKLFNLRLSEKQILLSGIDASIKNGISITGAYDDVCGCYYGGFAVTNNHTRKIIKLEKCKQPLYAVILLPSSHQRSNINKLWKLRFIFNKAWNLAKLSDYWNAMLLNGFATSVIFDYDPHLIINLIENCAISASISGNGPSIAAIVDKKNIINAQKIFSANDNGKILISKITNAKSRVYEL